MPIFYTLTITYAFQNGLVNLILKKIRVVINYQNVHLINFKTQGCLVLQRFHTNNCKKIFCAYYLTYYKKGVYLHKIT